MPLIGIAVLLWGAYRFAENGKTGPALVLLIGAVFMGVIGLAGSAKPRQK